MSVLFISHSSKDNEASAQVRDWLVSQGHNSIFLDFDPQDGIPSGRNWEQELYHQLRTCRAVIVLCSEHSMASDWCFAEITHARSLGKPLLPIRIDDCQVRSVLHNLQILDVPAKGWDDTLVRLGRGLKLAGIDPADLLDWSGDRPPYPGLLAFQEEDAAIFFGRSDEIAETLETLEKARRFGEGRMVLLLGSSGSGKSSLMRAGVVPRLRRDSARWAIVGPFRPGSDPFEALARTLARSLSPKGDAGELYQDFLDKEPAEVLLKTATKIRLQTEGEPETLLLVLDQVEELLEMPEEHPSHRFLAMLKTVLEQTGSELMAVGTLRSDYLGAFQVHSIPTSSVSLMPLPIESLAQVIEKPAQLVGLELEEGLTQALLADTETADALPLLAFSLRELYDRHGDDGRLDVKEYRDGLGGLQGSVRKAAEDLLALRPDLEEQLPYLRRAFLAMGRVNSEGQFARRPAKWKSLPEKAHPLLEQFVQARLLVSSSSEGERCLEVAHEALLRAWDRLNDWLVEERKALEVRARLEADALDWEKSGKEVERLFKEPFLTEARELLRDYELSEIENEYLAESIDEHDRFLNEELEKAKKLAEAERERAEEAKLRAVEQARATKRAYVGIGVALLLSMVSLGFFFQAEKALALAEIREKEATLATRQAVAQRLALESEHAMEETPQRALLLAATAMQYVKDGGGETTLAIESVLRRTISGMSGTGFQAHQSAVEGVAFDQTGERIATGDSKGQVKVWRFSDSTKGEVLKTIEVGSEIEQLSFRPHSNQLATMGKEGKLILWDLDKTPPAQRVLSEDDLRSRALEFSPDGHWLAIRSLDRTSLSLWNLESKAPELMELSISSDDVQAYCFDAKSEHLAAISETNQARIWDLSGAKPSKVTDVQHGKKVRLTSVCFVGSELATGDENGALNLWDLSKPSKPLQTKSLGDEIDFLFYSEAKHHLVCVSRGVSVYDTTNFEAPPRVSKTSVAWRVKMSQDGHWLVVAGTRELATLIDLSGPELWSFELRGHEAGLTAIDFHPSKPQVVTSSEDSTIRFWDANSVRRQSGLLDGLEGSVESLDFDPAGQRLATSSWDNKVYLWQVDELGPQFRPQVLRGHTDHVVGTEFFGDGKSLVSHSWDDTVRIWDLSGPEVQSKVLTGHTDDVEEAFLFNSDQQLATLSNDDSVRIWDLAAEVPSSEILIKDLQGPQMHFNSETQQLALVDYKVLRVWTVDSGKLGEPREFGAPNSSANAVRISHDGKWVAAGYDNGDIHLWSLEGDGKTEAKILSGHTAMVGPLAFSRDGKWLASGSEDHTCRLWKVGSKDPSVGGSVLSGHDQDVVSLAFDSKSERLASGSYGGVARLWSLKTGGAVESAVFTGHTSSVEHVGFSPDGGWLVTGANDSTGRYWKISEDELLKDAWPRAGRSLSAEEKVRHHVEFELKSETSTP